MTPTSLVNAPVGLQLPASLCSNTLINVFVGPTPRK